MSKLSIAALLIATLSQLPSLSAVTTEANKIPNSAVFGIEFDSEGQAYYARENTIRSISKQEYITAAFKVIEINIVSDSKALLRIYHTRELRPGELETALGRALDSTGLPGVTARPSLPSSVQAMADRAAKPFKTLADTVVIKEYPIATHAHTIEYRLSDEDELLELFEKLRKHWLKEPVESESTDGEDGENTTSKNYQLGGTLFTVDSF